LSTLYSLKLIHKISLFLYFTVVVEVVEEIFMAQDRCYSLHRFLTKTINVAQPLGFVVEQNTQHEEDSLFSASEHKEFI
jgi:hypothetical protein